MAGGRWAPKLPLHKTDGHICPAHHSGLFHGGLQLKGLASLTPRLGHSQGDRAGREGAKSQR